MHIPSSIIRSVNNSGHAKDAGGVFLHYKICLDLLFIENLLLNFYVLRLCSLFLHCSATRKRSFFAAAFGAGYAVLYVCMMRYVPCVLLFAAGIGVTTGMVKYGCETVTLRSFAAGLSSYVLAVFLFSSAFRFFRVFLPQKGIFFFGFTGSAAYAGILVLQKIRKEILMEKARTVTVQLIQNGRGKKVRGLYDTGNTLRDATTKKPVSVVPYTVILELFPDEMRTGIAAFARCEALEKPEQLFSLQPRYIRFCGLEGQGFLPVIRISEMILMTENTVRHVKRPLIALGGASSSSPRGYEMILHPDLMDRQEE